MKNLIIKIKKLLIYTLIFPLQAYAGPYFSICQDFAERTNELLKQTPIDSHMWNLQPTHCENGNPRDAYVYTYVLKEAIKNKHNVTKIMANRALQKESEMLRNGACNDESLGPALNIIDVKYTYKLPNNETIYTQKINIKDCKVGDLAKKKGVSGPSTGINEQNKKAAEEFLKNRIRDKSNNR